MEVSVKLIVGKKDKTWEEHTVDLILPNNSDETEIKQEASFRVLDRFKDRGKDEVEFLAALRVNRKMKLQDPETSKLPEEK